MKIDILALKTDKIREIEDLRRRLQNAECILEFLECLEKRFGEIQLDAPQTQDPLPERKWELIKQTGEKLRRRFCILDIKDHVCKKYPHNSFNARSFRKALGHMVKSGRLILVRQGHPGPKKTTRCNFYKLTPQP